MIPSLFNSFHFLHFLFSWIALGKLAITLKYIHRCQRSSQCPMCWQNISLKDPSRSIIVNLLPLFNMLQILLATFIPWRLIFMFLLCSQELLDAVENERSIRMNPPRNTTIFHHPALGDFELQHVCYFSILIWHIASKNP